MIQNFYYKTKERLEEALKSIVKQKLESLKFESKIDFNELEKLTNKIVQTCTKDAITVKTEFILFLASFVVFNFTFRQTNIVER